MRSIQVALPVVYLFLSLGQGARGEEYAAPPSLPDEIRMKVLFDAGQSAVESNALDTVIEKARQVLANPTSNPEQPARALHKRLVAPLAKEIDAAGIRSLLVHLDGRLRLRSGCATTALSGPRPEPSAGPARADGQ
jgi:hypothetical protein